MTDILASVAPFRMEVFRSYAEFERHLRASDAQRGARWLYERSLASPDKTVVLPGTCGLCLQSTRFTSPTYGGEPVPGGRVPNWRESLTCGCEHRLISRERALLHYLLATSLLRPWTRVLALGEVTALRPALSELSDYVECLPGPLDTALARLAPVRGGYHLIVSVEQLTARITQPGVLGMLIRLLTLGGAAVFTAPFTITTGPADGYMLAADGPVGWGVLDALVASGFTAARVCTYWSEELGYLGAFNMIITANKA